MGLSDLSDRSAVLQAISEFDELGRAAFLARYGYEPARSYFVVHDGKSYDSKALAGVAVGKQFPRSGPLAASDFSGGEATVKAKLEELGFEVTGPAGLDTTTITSSDVQLLREIIEGALRRYHARRARGLQANRCGVEGPQQDRH